MYYNKRNLIINLFWVILGIILLALSITEVLDSTYFGGIGGGLIAVGGMQLIRIRKYNSNPEYKEKIDVELGDERNRFLRMRAWSYTGYISILAECTALILAFFTGNEMIGKVVSFCICGQLGIYWISYAYLNNRY